MFCLHLEVEPRARSCFAILVVEDDGHLHEGLNWIVMVNEEVE
jgi:hypothetical protein